MIGKPNPIQQYVIIIGECIVCASSLQTHQGQGDQRRGFHIVPIILAHVSYLTVLVPSFYTMRV